MLHFKMFPDQQRNVLEAKGPDTDEQDVHV